MQPSIGILLRELTRLYAQASREHVTSGHDTSSTQSHVLIELGRAGLLTQHELGLRLSLDKGWVSRAVESLVQAELVTKSRNDNDRRSRWLQLTPQGNTRYQALNASLDTFAEQLMQPLASAQRSSIHQALLLLLNGLQGQLPADINEAASEVQLALAAAPDASPLTPAAQADAGLEAQAPFIAAAQPALSGHTPESATAAVDSRSNPIDVDSDATPAPALMHEAPAPTLQHDPVASDHTAASTVAQAAAPEPAPQVAAAPPAQAPLRWCTRMSGPKWRLRQRPSRFRLMATSRPAWRDMALRARPPTVSWVPKPCRPDPCYRTRC
jgi:DNA-binding MarR family transcriptional regulator